MIVPFSPPHITQDLIEEVLDTLNSGWITTGPKVIALEQEVKKLTDCKDVICVNSWTSGAMIVLKWLGVGPGDEVIIPAYTYSATALSVLNCGATPIMVDISNDFTIDTQKIREKISERTKVIMPVDIAGWMCDYDEIHKIVNDPEIKSKYVANSPNQEILGKILVLADAAHSIGAKYKKLNSGTAADITIFSFHAVKNITTAEGGAICLNLPDVFSSNKERDIMKLWTLNGQTKDENAGGWKYDILFQGLKVNMPDICAAIGLAQIKNYENSLIVRKNIFNTYSSYFSNFDWAELPPNSTNERIPSFHLYLLRIKGITEAQRDDIIELILQSEISVNVHFIPLPLLTLFRNLDYKIADYPNAYKNYSREISLPIYPHLTDDMIYFICQIVTDSYNKVCNAND